jgi:hypothetical protein
MRPFFSLFLILLSWQLSAQDCPTGFYLLRSDTIFELSKKRNGQPNFVPYYQADFLDSIGALAYHSEENYWYAVSQLHGDIMRFQTNGRIENLGRPKHEERGDWMPNEGLISAVIWGDELYILNAPTSSILAVDLSKKPLTYKNLATFNHSLPNSLSFDPNTKQLLLFHQNGGSIYFDPKTGISTIDNKKYKGFKRRSFLAYGKLWFDAEGQAFMLHGNQGELVHIDLEEKVVYEIAATGFVSTKDAVQCFASKAATPFPQDLLRMSVAPYSNRHSLQLEWMQGRNHKVEHYEMQANRSDGQGWVKVRGLDAFNAYQQSGRYAALDRYPKTGEHCYRLRIDYQGGHSRYSSSVCMNWPDSLQGSQWLLSPQFISEEWPYLELQTTELEGDLIQLRLYDLLNGQLILEKAFYPKGEDQGFLLALPARQGWHRVELISGDQIEQFSVYLNLAED